jgi:hypothetical protein
MTSKKHTLGAVGATCALVLGLGGIAAAGNTSATVDPASCVRGDTSTVCTVPHEQVTATETVIPAPETVTATVTETVTATPSETPTTTPPVVTSKVIVGMSAPASDWNTRLAEVGRCGVESRRIFADLTSTGRDQSTLIEQALNAGMTPVVSYKVPSVTTLNANGYDSWLAALNTYLGGFNKPITVTFWHEPHGDMTPAQFRDGSQQFLDSLTDSDLLLGPLLNGWLLDNRVSDWASYTSPALLNQWDFLGLDTYQSGSEASPGAYGGRAIPLARTWLNQQGKPDLPIVVGEYNGFTADSIAKGGEQVLLAANKVFAGAVWNSTGGTFTPLTGARLDAYKATKADSRALHEEGC